MIKALHKTFIWQQRQQATAYACLIFTHHSELSSANLVARVAAERPKTRFSATKSAHPSRVVAVSAIFASAAAAAATKSEPSRFAFVFY